MHCFLMALATIVLVRSNNKLTLMIPFKRNKDLFYSLGGNIPCQLKRILRYSR